MQVLPWKRLTPRKTCPGCDWPTTNGASRAENLVVKTTGPEASPVSHHNITAITPGSGYVRRTTQG